MTEPTKIGARALLAENLRRLRRAQNKSQEQLGEDAGFHRAFVSQVERQVNNVTLESLEKLATALQVEVAELLSAPHRSASADDE